MVGMQKASPPMTFMNHVKLATRAVKRVRSYPNSSNKSKINLIKKTNGKIVENTLLSIRKQIRSVVIVIGPKILLDSPAKK